MDRLFQIKLQGTADTREWREAQGALRDLTSEADKFIDSLKAGVGIDLGGKIVNSLAAIPELFQDFLSRGLDVNKVLGDSEIAIGNVLKKFQNLDDAAARREAAKAMEAIIALDPKSSASIQGLTEGFLATAASGQSAGLTVAQNIDLVGRFSNALANASIPAEQLAQELRAIFTGNITPDAALAKILQIDNADIARMKEAGTLYDGLIEKIGSLGVSGDTAGVAFSSMESAIDKAAQTLAKPLFEVLVESAKELIEVLGDPSIQASLVKLGVEIGNVAEVGFDLTRWALENADALIQVARAVTLIGGALAGLKLISIVAGLAAKAAAWARMPVLIGAETVALQANTSAQLANSAARAAGGAVGVGNVAVAGRALQRSVDEFGNVAYKGGEAAGARLSGGFGGRLSSLLSSVMNNGGVVIAAGIAGWEIGKWLDQKFEISDSIADKINAEGEQLARELSKSSQAFKVTRKIALATSPEQASESKRFAEAALADLRTTLDSLAANQVPTEIDLIKIKDVRDQIAIVERQLRDFERNVGTKTETPTGQVVSRVEAAAAEAAAAKKAADAQAELDASFLRAQASAGGAEQRIAALRKEYEILIKRVQERTGTQLGNDLDKITADRLAGFAKGEQGNGYFDDAEGVELLDEAIAKAKELGDAKKQVADEQQQAAEEQRQAAIALLELEVSLAEAKGDTARAEKLKADVAKARLAEDILKAGGGVDLEAAKKQASDAIDQGAAKEKAKDDEKLARAREIADLEDRILREKASGNEAQQKALEDELRARNIAAGFEASLGLSSEEALRRAKERVALERSLEGGKTRSDLDRRFDEAEAGMSGGGSGRGMQLTPRGLAGYEALQGRSTASTFSSPNLDSFTAWQNDPSRRMPVSSVEMMRMPAGAPDLRNPYERTNSIGAGGGGLAGVTSAAEAATRAVTAGSGEAIRAEASMRAFGNTVAAELKSTRDALRLLKMETDRQIATLQNQIRQNRN